MVCVRRPSLWRITYQPAIGSASGLIMQMAKPPNALPLADSKWWLSDSGIDHGI